MLKIERKQVRFLLLFLLPLFLIGCSNVIESKHIMFDYEKKYGILSKKLDFDIKGISKTLDREGVPEIVSAEKVEDDTSIRAVIVIEIETKDAYKYRLFIDQYNRVYAIRDMETDKDIYYEKNREHFKIKVSII